MEKDRSFIFEKERIPRAVMTMVIPTVISQIISIVYNMADTFFVGQLGYSEQVAAVSLSAPLSLTITALANLFGIGGASLMSRALGEKDELKAKRTSVFSIYTSLAVALVFSLAVTVFNGFFLTVLGTDSATAPFTAEYLRWVIVFGAVPSMMSMVLAHFVRADGAAKAAGYGLSLGGLLNLVLDPIFIFPWGLDMGVAGAAAATFISNVASLLYFAAYFVRKRGASSVSLSPALYSLRGGIGKDVIVTGLPSMAQTLLASVSNAVLNNLAKGFGSAAVAALGIVKKLDQIPMSITIGISQGVVPLMGYNHSARNQKRLDGILRFTAAIAIGFSLVCVAAFELFAGGFVRMFIADADTIAYGSRMLRIMCLCTPFMAGAFLMITMFQATGKNRQALILSVMRKGVVDIPLMIIMNLIYPLWGLVCVQPISEGLALAVAIIFSIKNRRKAAAERQS